jgi:hypothetical protein
MAGAGFQFLGRRISSVLPLHTLVFAFCVKTVDPGLVSSDNVIQKLFTSSLWYRSKAEADIPAIALAVFYEKNGTDFYTPLGVCEYHTRLRGPNPDCQQKCCIVPYC